MARRAMFAAAVGLLSALLLGTSSIAAGSSGFTVKIVANSCANGDFSYSAKATAAGTTAATELRVTIWDQKLRSGRWRDVTGSIGFDSKEFHASGRNHSISAARSGNAPSGQTWRLVIDFSAYDLNGDLLWSKTVHGTGCSG